MSNKRIQKKREKRAWQRDKSKLVAECLVYWYPGLSRAEYVRLAAPLLKMDKGPLLELLMRENLRHSPFRHLIPRKTWTGEVVNWRPITCLSEVN